MTTSATSATTGMPEAKVVRVLRSWPSVYSDGKTLFAKTQERTSKAVDARDLNRRRKPCPVHLEPVVAHWSDSVIGPRPIRR